MMSEFMEKNWGEEAKNIRQKNIKKEAKEEGLAAGRAEMVSNVVNLLEAGCSREYLLEQMKNLQVNTRENTAADGAQA